MLSLEANRVLSFVINLFLTQKVCDIYRPYNRTTETTIKRIVESHVVQWKIKEQKNIVLTVVYKNIKYLFHSCKYC